MSDAVRIWVAAAHDAAHRNGGWAYVRAGGAEPVGRAGGDRRTTRVRMALKGLLAALDGVAADAALSIVAPEPDARVIHALLKPPADPPLEDADLRTALAARLTGRSVKLAVGDPKGATPAAFAAAWADTASGKAKTSGAFEAAIPRSNLARLNHG